MTDKMIIQNDRWTDMQISRQTDGQDDQPEGQMDRQRDRKDVCTDSRLYIKSTFK